MRKLIAVLVSFAMIFAMIPTIAFANEGTTGSPEYKINLKAPLDYTGESIDPVESVTASGEVLGAGKYTISYKKVVDETTGTTEDIDKVVEPGSYEVIATITAEPDAVVKAEFTVNKLDPAKVVGSIDTQKIETTFDNIDIKFIYFNNDKQVNVTLKKGTDYTITNPSNSSEKVKKGANTVTVKFQGDHFTEVDYTHNITFGGKQDISSLDVTAKEPAITPVKYTPGYKYTTTFTFSDSTGNLKLTEGTDYEVEYTGNDKANAPVKATIKGKGDYFGEKDNIDLGVTIEPRDINLISSNAKVETSTAPDVAPNVTITDVTITGGSYKLVQGTDYYLYVDPKNEENTQNKYTVTINGMGNYFGSFDKTFSVGKPIDSVTCSTGSFEYNGYSQRPAIKVTSGGVEVPSSGYRIEWPEDTTNAGDKTFTVVGIGDYSGTVAGSYVITAKSASKLTVTLSGKSFAYSGNFIKPSVTVRDGSRTLTEGAKYDYSVSYTGNISPGTATATISFNNKNYTGSLTEYFYIGKKSISALTVTLDKYSYNYDGRPITPRVTVTDAAGKTVSSINYAVEIENNKAVGTGTVTVYGKGEYYGSITKTFTIQGKTISNCTVTLAQTKYAADGTAKTPSVTVKDGYTTLVKDRDYTVTYANNRTPGTATVTVTGKGAYGGSQTVTFTITGLDQDITVQEDYTKFANSKPFSLDPEATGDGTGFTYTSSDTSVVTVSRLGEVTIVGAGKAYITVSTVGDKKYTPATAIVEIKVKPNKGSLKLGTPLKNSFRIYIDKKKGVDGYQVRYTKGTNYKYFYTKHVKNDNKTQYRTVRKLKKGSKYKVAVRGYRELADGTKMYGSWSTSKYVTVR